MKIEELTFFRFIAASIVVIFHYGRDATKLGGIFIAGSEMVTFFFVLSGFVMGIVYLNKNLNPTSYWWARISRIVPVYMLALILTLLVNYVIGIKLDYSALILNLTFLQAWFPPYSLSMNVPSWAVSVEAFFYLLFPFLIAIIKQYNLSALTMLIIALGFWLLTQLILVGVITMGWYHGYPSISHDLIYYFPLSHLCSFMLGIAGAALIINNHYSIKNEFISLLVFSLALFLVVMSINHADIISRLLKIDFTYKPSFFAPIFLIVILTISICRSQLLMLLKAKPLLLLGESSYSLYILQHPIYIIFAKYIGSSLPFNSAIKFTLFFLFLTLISVLCFLVFEKPMNKFLREKMV